jgi:hypothetical protein
VLLPSVADADWLFSPFIGGAFAGSTALPDLEQGASATQIIFGGSAGWWSPGIFGFEGDFAYAPRFFETDNQGGIVINSNAMTFSGSVIVATPVSVTRESLRPYLVGGLGWMHASIDEIQNVFPEIFGRARNSVGLNFGGGAVGFITPRTGVRFEVRQFRSLERDENLLTGETKSLLSFWRATVAVVIKR